MTSTQATDNELQRRALAAYYRTTDSESGVVHTAPKQDVVVLNELKYVRLTGDDDSVVAVYRVTNQGQLRRLRRWPKELRSQ